MPPSQLDPRIAVLEGLAGVWNAAGIRYGVAHGLEGYPTVVGRDLDVIVDRKQLDRILKLSVSYLQEAGFVVVVPPNPWQARAIFAFSGEIEIEVDFIPWLFWGPVLVVDGPRPTAELGPFFIDAWASFAKRVIMYTLGGREPKSPLWLPELEPLLRPHCNRLFGARLTDELFDALKSLNSDRVLALAPRLRKTMLRRVLLRPSEAARMVVPWLSTKIRPYLTRRAPIIALAGPDGIGKTATTHEFVANAPAVFTGIETRHWRPSVLPRLGKLVGKPAQQADINGYFVPRRKAGRFSLLRVAYYGLDYILGHFVKDRRQSSELRLICYDRHAVDMVVDPVRYGLPSERQARWLFRSVPKPDLTVLFNDDSERIYARKKELPLEEIDALQRRWLKMAGEGAVGAIIRIDAPPEEIAARLKVLSIEAFARGNQPTSSDAAASIRWLNDVMNSGETSKLVSGGVAALNGAGEQWQQAEQYSWFGMADGRGYLIPLDTPEASIQALEMYPAQSLKARLAKRMLAAGLRLGIAQRFLPRVAVLQRKGAARSEAAGGSLLAYLRQVVFQEDLAFGVSLGAPGPFRKPVLQALAPDGNTLAYVRVGRDAGTNAAVQREAEVLQELNARSLQAFSVPNLIHFDEWHGRVLGVQTAPRGKQVRDAPQQMNDQYMAVVREMASDVTWGALRDSAFWQTLTAQVEPVENVYYRHVLDQSLRRAEAALADEVLPFHLAHGDLTPWNARLVDGKLFLFDWESADRAAPPGWDLFRFLVQTMWLLEKRLPGAINEAFRPGGSAAAWVAEHLEGLGVNRALVFPLYELYLTQQLTLYVTRDSRNYGHLHQLSMMLNLAMYDNPVQEVT